LEGYGDDPEPFAASQKRSSSIDLLTGGNIETRWAHVTIRRSALLLMASFNQRIRCMGASISSVSLPCLHRLV